MPVHFCTHVLGTQLLRPSGNPQYKYPPAFLDIGGGPPVSVFASNPEGYKIKRIQCAENLDGVGLR